MNVYRDISQLPKFKKAVLTIGTFDGVHLGHASILSQLLTIAREIDGTPVVITFHPHPKTVVGTENSNIQTLNTPKEKFELLAKKGIKDIVVVPFTPEFAQLPAKDYIEKFLVEKFNPHTIIIGYDHKFGNNREGDYLLLEKEAVKFGFRVMEIPEHVLRNITISSTKIRQAMLKGDIVKAASYLGYDYFFSGRIIEGNKLGRTIGYPTANIKIEDDDKLIPANGVYAVTVMIENEGITYKGMMNIGVRPTIGGSARVIEVNIFDFNKDIYGKEITVAMKARIRDEVRFKGLDELKNQLMIDKSEAIRLLELGIGK